MDSIEKKIAPAQSLTQKDATQMHVSIIRLEKQHIPQAVKILTEAFNESAWSMKRCMKRSLSNNNYKPVTFVAMLGDKIVGTVQCLAYPPMDGVQWCSISHLAVDPGYRQKGIGHALIHHAEEFIHTHWIKDFPAVIGVIDETKLRDPQSQFYEKMGYVPESDPRSDHERPILIKSYSPKLNR